MNATLPAGVSRVLFAARCKEKFGMVPRLFRVRLADVLPDGIDNMAGATVWATDIPEPRRAILSGLGMVALVWSVAHGNHVAVKASEFTTVGGAS